MKPHTHGRIGRAGGGSRQRLTLGPGASSPGRLLDRFPSVRPLGWLAGLFWLAAALRAGEPPAPSGPGDEALGAYFRAETARLGANCLADIKTLEDWTSRREGYRQQLLDMLGLWPLPERTGLEPVITGRLEQPDFAVEKLQFQSLPGFYATANLYLPKGAPRPAPAILYVCGHAAVLTNGVSCGNKTAYQHHGVWFARNGYVCLVLDTVQLGELQGIHHGTYRERMWWWNARGYTPAGAEAWNCIRALDYLEGRSEVDPQRLGVTGRSGGGAYSWWLAAVDDRVKAAAPVAGITDLQNHVVDGTVEGHCDCMFMVNTYRWDYPHVAALVAPRPLLLGNSDKDTIFPLDGVERLHAKLARIYALYGASNRLGLLITEGPHRDTQDLQLPVFRWFNRHLRGQEPLIEMAARPQFAPLELRVFGPLPADERTTRIHESLVPVAPTPAVPASAQEWPALSERWREGLRTKVFAGWPSEPGPLESRQAGAARQAELRLEAWDFTSQPTVPLRLYVLSSAKSLRADRVVLHVLDESEWPAWLAAMSHAFPAVLGAERAAAKTNAPPPDPAGFAAWRDRSRDAAAFVFLAPRGIGLNAWTSDERKQTQLRRRFMLLGQTLDSMRVWDIRRAVQAIDGLSGLRGRPVWLRAQGSMGANALYAAVFEPRVRRLDLWRLPASHRLGPDYLNVLRVLDLPQAVALACEHAAVALHETEAAAWQFPLGVRERLGWQPARLVVEGNARDGASATR